jgi:hypothetical protein
MSGIAVGLAYTGAYLRGDYFASFKKMWARAFKLYWVHLLVTIACVIILVTSIEVFDTQKMIKAVTLKPLIDYPNTAPFGLAALTFQIGYVNILPLYMMLLFMAPAFMWLAIRNRWVLLTISGLVWFALHVLFYERIYINMPNWPHGGRWFLNPFAWQFIFVIGMLVGMSLKTGKPFAPFNSFIYLLALAYALFAFYWVQNRMGALPFNDDLPRIFKDFNKSYLSLPRLLHVVAIAYLITHTKWPDWFSKITLIKPIELMGKHALPVFATGTVLSIFLQCFRKVIEPTIALDVMLFSAGILIQYYVAVYASRRKVLQTKSDEISGKPVLKTSQNTLNSAKSSA